MSSYICATSACSRSQSITGASRPVSVAQRRHVVRVGQHAHVEHVVGVQRHAALEGEGLEHQRERALRRRDQRLDVALQLRRPDDAGVDHVGAVAQVGQQLAFELDGIDQRALLLGAPRRAGPGATADGAGGFRKSAAPACRWWRRGTASAAPRPARAARRSCCGTSGSEVPLRTSMAMATRRAPAAAAAAR